MVNNGNGRWVLSQWLTAPAIADLRDRLNTIDRMVSQIRAIYPPLTDLLTAPLRDTIPTSLEGYL